MANNELHTALKDMVNISKSKGYLLFDDILDITDKFDLPLDALDRISDRLLTMGIIIREDDNHTLVIDDEDSSRSKVNYDFMFDEIISEYPSLEGFINEVRLIPPPRVKEVDSLIYQAMDGNKYAYDRIIKMYLKVVVRKAYLLSRQYYLPLEDTIQDGVLGLISAYELYNPTSDKCFSTQIGWMIRNAIIREASTINPQVYFPVHVKEQLFSIYDLVFEHQCESCLNTNICPILVQEVSKKLNVDVDIAYTYINYLSRLESTDYLIENKGDQFTDNNEMSEYIINSLYNFEITNKISIILGELKEREARIIKLRYGFDGENEKTLQEVGQIFEITRERVRQIEANTVRKLRNNKEIKLLKNI